MEPLFSRGGIEEDDLGEIKDFSIGHQSLDDKDPDLSLSAILLWKDDFDSRIISVPKFAEVSPKKMWGCLFGFAVSSFFLIYHLIVKGGSEGGIGTYLLEIHSLSKDTILFVILKA